MPITKKYKNHIIRNTFIIVFLMLLLLFVAWLHQKTDDLCNLTNDFVLDSGYHLLNASTVPLFAFVFIIIIKVLRHSRFKGNRFKKIKKVKHDKFFE